MSKALSALRVGVVAGVALVTTVVAMSASPASAQSVVTINQSKSQVVYATLRGGSYGNTNYGTLIATQADADLASTRRGLLKFDTQNLVPAGAPVTSAILTLTVKSGGSDATRTISAYQGTTSWTETEVTWNRRRVDQAWLTAGGDLGTELGRQPVSNVAGNKVSFDVTALVKQAVSGSLGTSRYTRIELVDRGTASANSYREFASPDDSNSASRPVLKVTYGSAAAAPPSGSTLRVLQWNTHHGGYRTDGVWDTRLLMNWVAKINPDIVSLNEVEYKTSWSKNTDNTAEFVALLKQITGKTWYSKFVTATGGTTGNGNAILSRIPFDSTATRLLSHDRAVASASITVNGRTINFFSTHLDADSTSYRLQEIGELTSWASTLSQQRIICGDFNAWPGSTENATMGVTFKDSWAAAQSDGTAVAYAGNTAGNTRNSRIDYVYYSRQATGLTLVSSQVFDTRDSHGVMPSDHRPVLSVFTVK